MSLTFYHPFLVSPWGTIWGQEGRVSSLHAGCCTLADLSLMEPLPNFCDPAHSSLLHASSSWPLFLHVLSF